MILYTKEQTANIDQYQFAFVQYVVSEHVLSITLDRPAKKNALHPQMTNEIAFLMHYAHFETTIWIVIFQAKGDVFCAGLDLKALAGEIEAHNSTIPEPKAEVLIAELFNEIRKPCIAKVNGDVYAGGLFFLAGCLIVVAQKDVKIGLPEVKRGLFPFQVMAALMRVMPERKVLDWCIRGYNLSAKKALKYGLITEVISKKSMNLRVQEIIEELKENSPTAMQMGLLAYTSLMPKKVDHSYLKQMLDKTINSEDGQEGLKAFIDKRKPSWKGQ